MRNLPIPRPTDFRSRIRGPELTARIGLWLGICFTLAFVTGVISHFAQDTPSWLTFPTRPVSLYRVTQGLHVASGTAAVPLLLVKLWSVFPKLFDSIDLRHARTMTLQLLERGSIAVLVAAAIFELATGLSNAAQWYWWSFHFRATHYAVGWLAFGALLVHIAVKLPLIKKALTTPLDDDVAATATTSAMSRRAVLRTTWLAAGVAVVSTAGATVPLLRKVSVFGVRSGDGPAGIPINKSAAAAQVGALALHPDYMLTLTNGSQVVKLSRADLAALPQHESTLPIACVEGWSASGTWRGVRMSDLMALVGSQGGNDLLVNSLQPSGPYTSVELQHQFADDDLTLLALGLNGDDLSIDHGFPCRVIAPDRPGVLQTKWVSSIEVLA